MAIVYSRSTRRHGLPSKDEGRLNYTIATMQRDSLKMPLIDCPECRKSISSLAPTCPSCGYPVAQVAQTIHSDFLIHWTGLDIEKQFPGMHAKGCSEDGVAAYLKRLKDILKYGLWMTKRDSNEQEILEVNGLKIAKPLVARTCFTELKLSQARAHAEKFGRLGIGVKRYYLFDRLGGPMKYVQFGTRNLFFPPYSSQFEENGPDHELLSFFKHMCSRRPLKYDLFAESEWRIVYSESIKKKVSEIDRTVADKFVDPAESQDSDLRQYWERLGKKPEYLLPLDGWLAMIIYPFAQVKNAARQDTKVRELIEAVKQKRILGPQYECEMWPMEIDLDACSHF